MHDNAISRPTNNEYTDLIGKVVIGNNCFIGFGSIFLPGVTIADDCIVAAGTVVSKSVLETGKVIAGNPCRVIGTVKDYVEKNLSHAVDLKGKSWDERIDYMLNNEQKYIHRKSM